MYFFSKRTFFPLAVLFCIISLTGCLKRQPSRTQNPAGQSSSVGDVSMQPDEDIPTYVITGGPDVSSEPPSPFFSHHVGNPGGAGDTSDRPVVISKDDTALFAQRSPFDSSPAINNRSEMNSKDGVSRSSKSVIANVSREDSRIESTANDVLDSISGHQKTVVLQNPKGTQASRSLVDSVPLDEAFPLQEHVAAIVEDPALERETSYIVGRGDTLWGIASKFKLTTKQLIAANRGVNDANVISVGMKLIIPPADYDPSKRYIVPGTLRPYTSSQGKNPSSQKDTGLSSARTRADSSSGTRNTQSVPVSRKPAPESIESNTASAGLNIPTAKDLEVHVLQKGETLWSVARQYKISVTDLMLLNRLGEASSLRAGREIFVPGGRISNTARTAAGSSGRALSANASSGGGTQYSVQKGDTLWRISREFSVTVSEIVQWNKNVDLDRLAPGMKINVSPPSGVYRAPERTVSTKTSSPHPVQAPLPSSNYANPSTGAASRKQPGTPSKPSSGKVAASTPSTANRKILFHWPLRGSVIKSFGWYNGKPHTGIDVKGAVGDRAMAAADGVCYFCRSNEGVWQSCHYRPQKWIFYRLRWPSGASCQKGNGEKSSENSNW